MAITDIIPATVTYDSTHAWLPSGFLRPDAVADFTFKDDGIDVTFHNRAFKRYWDFPCEPRNISAEVTYSNGRFYIPTDVATFTFDWITEPWTCNLVGAAWQGGGDMRFMSKHYNGYLYNAWATYGTGNDALMSSDDWVVPTKEEWHALRDYLIAEYDYIADTGADGWGNHLKGRRFPPDPSPFWGNDATHIPLDTFNFAQYGTGSRLGSTFLNHSNRAYFWTGMTSEWHFGRIWFLRDQSYIQTGTALEASWSNGYGAKFKRAATAGEIASLSDGDYAAKYVGNDGKQYYTVYFGVNGGEVWMAADIAETQFRNNSEIPWEGADGAFSGEEWEALTTSARCAYNNDESLVMHTSTIAAISDGVTYDAVSELFTIPVGVTEFTFTKDGADMIWSEGEFYYYVEHP